MTDKPRDLRFQVSADRASATGKVGDVKSNQDAAADSSLSQLDEGGVPVASDDIETAIAAPQEAVAQPVDDEAEEQLVEDELVQAIENQLEAQQPPAVQAVMNKLTLVGHTREDIVQMMAQVLAWQISLMLEADQPFDMVAYESALRTLPQLPDAP